MACENNSPDFCVSPIPLHVKYITFTGILNALFFHYIIFIQAFQSTDIYC